MKVVAARVSASALAGVLAAFVAQFIVIRPSPCPASRGGVMPLSFCSHSSWALVVVYIPTGIAFALLTWFATGRIGRARRGMS